MNSGSKECARSFGCYQVKILCCIVSNEHLVSGLVGLVGYGFGVKT